MLVEKGKIRAQFVKAKNGIRSSTGKDPSLWRVPIWKKGFAVVKGGKDWKIKFRMLVAAWRVVIRLEKTDKRIKAISREKKRARDAQIDLEINEAWKKRNFSIYAMARL